MGLGRHGGGVAAAQFLAEHGAMVTVTDVADEYELRDSLAELSSFPIATFHLGEHRIPDFSNADLVVVNPAVRPGNRFVEIARSGGAIVTSEIELFLQRCQAPVIGITGTNGKSTTAAMTAAAIEAAGGRAWLGGNFGRSLLPHLPQIQPEHFVVLELSSFQLHWLNDDAPPPHVAVFTGCTPNHLDWHGDFEHYEKSKCRLLANGSQVQTVIANDPFSLMEWVGERAFPELSIPGEHNRRNAEMAVAAAVAAGRDRESAVAGVCHFKGLPHRLETVATIDGRTFINDTQSTTPESTIAALEALADRACWLLAGGADKGVSFDGLATVIAKRAAGAALFGATGPVIAAAIHDAVPTFQADALEAALQWCWQQSAPGDAILLSPACASFDQYRDCAERAADFVVAIERIRSMCLHPSVAERML